MFSKMERIKGLCFDAWCDKLSLPCPQRTCIRRCVSPYHFINLVEYGGVQGLIVMPGPPTI